MKMAEPDVHDVGPLKRVLRYLRGKPRVALFFRWQESPESLNLLTGREWASCHQTRWSKSGGVLLHGASCNPFLM